MAQDIRQLMNKCSHKKIMKINDVPVQLINIYEDYLGDNSKLEIIPNIFEDSKEYPLYKALVMEKLAL